MQIDYTDRIYKLIDAEIGKDKFIRILSKIDKDQNIILEFYHYDKKDIDKKDGTIKNKRNAYITEKMSIDKFDEVINKFSKIYPTFKIIGTIDYSDLTLKESVELINNIPVLGKIIHFDKEKKIKMK